MDLAALLNGSVLVITGGTGTLGQALVAEIMACYQPRKLVIASRSESRQAAMRERWPETDSGPLRYFIADVRDARRMVEVFEGADIVIHGAALKRVEVCEREPVEAVQTNIVGTINAAQAARTCGVSRFMFISSDKATAACTLYGGSKYVAERTVIGMANYRGQHPIRYSAVRYGNVLGSTGSAATIFRACNGRVPITDPRCTRFFLTPQSAARFVLSSVALMRGSEVFIPKLPSASVLDLAAAFAPGARPEIIGLRSAEKLHECLLSADEARWARELADRYVLLPALPFWTGSDWRSARPVECDFAYTSDLAPRLTPEQLREMVDA